MFVNDSEGLIAPDVFQDLSSLQARKKITFVYMIIGVFRVKFKALCPSLLVKK